MPLTFFFDSFAQVALFTRVQDQPQNTADIVAKCGALES